MPPKSKRARSNSSGGARAGGSGGSAPAAAPAAETKRAGRRPRKAQFDLAKLDAGVSDDDADDGEQSDAKKKTVLQTAPKRKRGGKKASKSTATSTGKQHRVALLSPADQALEGKFAPIIEKMTAIHGLQSAEATHRRAAETLIAAGGTAEDPSLALEYEHQDAGLLSLPSELIVLVFKFFEDIPLCLARLAMTCRQLYMLTST